MKILQILIFSVIFMVVETESNLWIPVDSTGNRPEERRGRRMGTLFLILSFSHFSSLGPILYGFGNQNSKQKGKHKNLTEIRHKSDVVVGGLKRIHLFKLIFLSSRLKKKHKVFRFGLWP
jgi:hypothetical protein